MAKDKVDREIVERHLEREYEKSYTRRRHTHDLINKVFTVHISLFLAVLAACGYLFYESSSPDDVRIVVAALLIGALAIGIVFYLSIINLHISRDYYRVREKILYVALRESFYPKYTKVSQEEINDLLDHYESFSRYHLTKPRGKWRSNIKSLFKMYRLCIYFSTGLLSSLLTINIISMMNCNYHIGLYGWVIAILCAFTMVILQMELGKRYSSQYLESHKTGFDTPNHLEDYWKKRK